jgi:Ni,Fe-hydrogenase I cytochrome b subunit
VSLPGYQGNLQASISHSQSISSWERLGVEIILTFVVVFTYFVSTNTHRKVFGNSAAMIGAAYSACNFVSVS